MLKLLVSTALLGLLMSPAFAANPLSKGCLFPPPTEGQLSLTVGAYEGQDVASVYLDDEDEETSVAIVEVQPGKETIHLTIAGVRPMIWKIEGAVDRIGQLVVGGRMPSGVVGLDPSKVTFLPTGCIEPHYEVTSGSPFIRGTYTLDRMTIPSMDIVGRSDYRKVDPVLVDFDPAEVVSSATVSDYSVLPGKIGLEQLVASGVILAIPFRVRPRWMPPSSSDWKNTVYRIVAPIPRLPPALSDMHYSLARGTPMPSGADEHSCFLFDDSTPPSNFRGELMDCARYVPTWIKALKRELGIVPLWKPVEDASTTR